MLNEILNSPLFSESVLSKLSELYTFIVKENIWQRSLLSISSFRTKARDYDVDVGGDKELWNFSKYSLIKADLVLFNDEEINLPSYLYPIEQLNNCPTSYYYLKNSDKFYQFKQIEDVSKIDLTRILSFEDSIEFQLYFHPYRIYGINRIFKIVEFGRIVKYQPFLGIDGLERCNREKEKMIKSYMESNDIWKQIKFYNVLIDLCIITETVFHRSIFKTIQYPTVLTYEKFRLLEQKLQESQEALKYIYESLSLKTIKLIQEWFVWEARQEDDNRRIHILLRMMNKQERDRLNGKLGLAMLFLEMAEVIRRAAEFYFNLELKEEHKVNGGYFDDIMKQNFGSVRILDNPVTKTEFIRYIGLDYTLRAKIYVEGITEYGFLEEVFSEIHSVQLIHLEGQFSEGKKKGLAFRDSLLEDKRLHIFSFVFIDSDRKDNIRVLEQSIKNNEFFGMFLKSDPDFECGNFSAKELYLAFCNYNNIIENPIFTIKQTEIKSGKDFFKVVSELHPEQRLSKSKEWGKVLFSFIKENELERKYLIEFIQKIFTSLKCSYERHIQLYRVDPKTGLLTDRK